MSINYVSPVDTATLHWALKQSPDNPLICRGEIAFENHKTACAYMREVEVLTGAMPRKAELCAHGDHWHLRSLREWYMEGPPRRQQRNVALLQALRDAPEGLITRIELRDSIDWGDRSAKQRNNYFGYQLSVLENYGVVVRNEGEVRIIDPDYLGRLM